MARAMIEFAKRPRDTRIRRRTRPKGHLAAYYAHFEHEGKL